ncbi:MAG: NAD+ synthase [Actinomycetota bacterium]
MDGLRLSLAQINPTVGDLDGNAACIAAAIAASRDAGSDLVAFPELAVTGYPPEDLVLKPSFVRDNRAALRAVARSAEGIAAVVGFVDERDGRLFNAAALLAEGGVRAVYHKQVLPNYGVFDERRWFTPGTGIVLGRIRGWTFGITVCEDLWAPDGPHAACAAAGANLVVVVNASPFHIGKSRERQDLVAARADETGLLLAYVNLVGGQDELVFDGQSFMVGPQGLFGRAAPFEEELVHIEIRGCAVPRTPAGELEEAAGQPVTLVELPGGGGEEVPATVSKRIAPEPDPTAAAYAALVLGTRDYLRKNGFDAGAIVGLSGGIDSSLTAAIAADAIGPGKVLGVLLPSSHTSEESNELALALADALGIGTVTLPIGPVFDALMATLAPVFAGTEWGTAEENLQARVRGTLLMAISNKTGRILLSTGNKSEMATGYATLYGDMAGGFAVLKDVPKTLVWELSRWRNRQGEVIPQAVIDRPPTAELRPGQLDTDSLPPYEVLDPILAALVERDRDLEDIVAEGFDPAAVRRVAELVDRAEYKRRQAAPGIKITERAFGRDRRLPITNRYRPAPPA